LGRNKNSLVFWFDFGYFYLLPPNNISCQKGVKIICNKKEKIYKIKTKERKEKVK